MHKQVAKKTKPPLRSQHSSDNICETLKTIKLNNRDYPFNEKCMTEWLYCTPPHKLDHI